jgi:hypothetical protein
MDVPDCWQQAFSAVSFHQLICVKSLNHRSSTIPPYQTITVTGKVRDTGEMTVGVTESLDSSHYLSVCPRVENVRSGNVLSKIPVQICNLSARPVKIGPKTVLCNLKPAEVV